MIRDTVLLAIELVALFYGVAFAIQLLQRRIGGARLQAWMGGSAPVAALKGITIGFITPFCTFSAVPMLVGFRQANVRTAGFVAFIVAAPVLDPVLFGALILIVGLPAALIYLAVAFTAALGLALTADAIGIDHHLKDLTQLTAPKPALATLSPTARTSRSLAALADRPGDTARNGGACGTNADEPWRGWPDEIRNSASAASTLLRSVAVVLAIGVGVGIAIQSLVSPETAANLTGDNSLLSIPVAAILGTPLYFSTALFVPIADALTAAGVGIGAIVALTISGAGASLPEFLLLTKLASTRILSVFFAYVLTIALAGGLLAQLLA